MAKKPDFEYTISDVFEVIDSYYEGENYHEQVGQAETIFDSISEFIPKKDHLKAATAIGETLLGDYFWDDLKSHVVRD